MMIVDGNIGAGFERFVSRFGSPFGMLDIRSYFKPEKDIQEIVMGCMHDDPLFGNVFGGKIEELLDTERLAEAVSNGPKVVFGTGAYNEITAQLAREVYWLDLVPEEIVALLKAGRLVPVGSRAPISVSENSPAYLTSKRLHYFDLPLVERHRKAVLKRADYYADSDLNVAGTGDLNRALESAARLPLSPAPHYDPAPWGGQWLKKTRELRTDKPNVGWSYDLLAPDVAITLQVPSLQMNVPFQILLYRHAEALMGSHVTSIFGDVWPIRVNYDDTLPDTPAEHGMGIHVHPDSEYVKESFGETFGQQESYYILAAGPEAKVYLGLKDGADLEEFRKAAERSEKTRVPVDFEKYLNAFPAKAGDLFLIPTGTIHSAKNCVVLEVSATTVRYTLRIYDYLRPDLDGKMRPLSSKHAFKVINAERRTAWIKDNLIQAPLMVRKRKNFTEFMIGRHDDLFFEIRRIEFSGDYPDAPLNRFHILVLAKGEAVEVVPDIDPKHSFTLKLSESVIIPASMGPYTVRALRDGEHHIVKAFVK